LNLKNILKHKKTPETPHPRS